LTIPYFIISVLFPLSITFNSSLIFQMSCWLFNKIHAAQPVHLTGTSAPQHVGGL